jgi:hypothetical protein
MIAIQPGVRSDQTVKRPERAHLRPLTWFCCAGIDSDFRQRLDALGAQILFHRFPVLHDSHALNIGKEHVARMEWLRWLPHIGFLPQFSQTAMFHLSHQVYIAEHNISMLPYARKRNKGGSMGF